MAILFGGDAGIQENSFSGFIDEITDNFNYVKDTITNAIEGMGPPPPPKENVHVDTGFANVPGTSFVDSAVDNVDDIKQRRITSQEPSLTVYVKKRAFWGLSSENDTRFMDEGEKLFMRASKLLFEKKCSQIAAYESLTKMSRLVSEDSHLDAAQIDLVIELLSDFITNIGSTADDEISAAVSKQDYSLANDLRTAANTLNEETVSLAQSLTELSQKSNKLKQATNTTWVIDPDQKDLFGVGRGSGVIELTLVSSANTSLGMESEGSFSLTVQDPYNLTKITTDDIEISLAAAQAEKARFDEKSFYGEYEVLGGPSTLLELARTKEEELRRIRKNKIADLFGFDRTAIGDSNAAEIIFEISVSPGAADPVVAYTTSTDVPPFNKDSFRIAMLQLPVEEQLTIEEDTLVGEIFDLLGQYIDAIKRLNAEILDVSGDEEFKHARKSLRMHYLGKAIVQPMDSVHIYIRGNTVKHNELIGPLSNVLNGSTFIQDIAKDTDVSDAVIEAEMKEFGLGGLDIPLEFYKSIRTGSFMRNAGMHVFGGVVSTVSETYNASNGTYVLNISGESNLKWLNLSRVNTRPSLNQPRGMLEDPLTPFKYDIDEATGLIKNKPELLNTNQGRIKDGLLFDKYGTSGVKKVTSPTDFEQSSAALEEKLQVIWKHAPGAVYKWKPGVMVATYDVNLATSLQGKDDDLENLKRYVGLNIVDQPFAGLDAADIVSLLVTGFPHSADKFYENSKGIGTFSEAGSNAAPSYFHSFFDITRSTNTTFGNFKPFRSVEIEGAALAQRIKLQQTLKEGYSKIDTIRSDLASIQDKLLLIGDKVPATASETLEDKHSLAVQGLEDAQKKLREELRAEQGNLQNRELAAKEDGLIKDTSGIVFKLDEIPGGIEDDAHEETAVSIRLKNKVLQMRTQYDCKFNTDENLFIMSDKYDKDRDIQAFIRKLKQQQNLFNSDYQHPIEICREVTKTLDFEFFCMAKDTIILTMNAAGQISSKYIQNVGSEDSVMAIDTLTQEISWKRASLSKRKLGIHEKMLSIRSGNGVELVVSDGHKLLDKNMNEVLAGNIKVGDMLATASCITNIEEPISINIEKLFIDHRWYKNNGQTFTIAGQGSKCKHIPKTVKLDSDISWMLGMYVAEGSVSDPDNRKNKTYRGYHTVFSLNYNEYDIAKRISSIISERFNIKSKIYRYKKYGRCTVDVGSFVFSKIIKSIFGRTRSQTKKIPPIMWRAESCNKIAFLSGIFVGDGTYNRGISVSSASNYLLNDIHQMLLMLNINSKIDKYNKIHMYGKENLGRFIGTLGDWKYTPSIIKYCSSVGVFNNRKISISSKVKGIIEIEYSDYVYDLEVEDNHTFLVGSTWSHNCDSQGHLRFRPPQYNRVPLSLILKMFLLNNKDGQQLYPDFLTSIFQTRLGAIEEESENLNDQIKIGALLLNLSTESDAVAAQITKNITEEDITGETYFTKESSLISADLAKVAADKIVEIRNRIEASTGRKSYLQNKDTALEQIIAHNDPKNPQINSIRLQTTNSLKALVGRRQQVETLKSRMKAQGEKYKVDIKDFSKDKLAGMLAPFQDLIEDDFNDFLGPGSSKRFIVYDDQLISSNFTESDQNAYCRVDVNGEIDFIGNAPGELAPGLPTLWAGATDFDMWRMYGYRPMSVQNKPFLKDAKDQCAPYALFLLSRARKDVVKGSITVYGNEYYQVGDVIYINSRDMLFYVWDVKHSFSYDSGLFQTTLDLRYGHVLGEYIPTPLDVIGKSLIRNQEKFNKVLVSRETTDTFRGVHLGLVIFEDEESDDEFETMLTEPFARFNVTELKRSLLIARSYIEGPDPASFPKVEVRGWYFNEVNKDKVQKRIDEVVRWLKDPRGRWVSNEDKHIRLADHFYDSSLQDNEIMNILMNGTDTPVQAINLSEPLEGDDKLRARTPNDEVYNATQDGNPKNIIEMVLLIEE